MARLSDFLCAATRFSRSSIPFCVESFSVCFEVLSAFCFEELWAVVVRSVGGFSLAEGSFSAEGFIFVVEDSVIADGSTSSVDGAPSLAIATADIR